MSSTSLTVSSPSTNYGHIVSSAISRRVMAVIFREVEISDRKLWASSRMRNFRQRMIEATLYKDITGCSFLTLSQETKIRSLWPKNL